MKKFKINFFRYNLNSILVNWPQNISIEISNDINSFCKLILNYPNILEFRKGYCSLLIIFKTILLADLGPKPGSLEINFINSSISSKFCII